MKHLIWLILGLMLSASPLIAEPASDHADIPKALSHMVKAPDIDFANLRDPFASYLARVANSRRAAVLEKQKILANRERDPLEAFDLDVLRLVAVFSMGGERVAMIEDATKKGYIVRKGSYLGKNNGKIDKIDDKSIFLTEQILNPAGEIVSHQVTLTMKELNE